MAMTALFLALFGWFLFSEDRNLRRDTDIDEIKYNPRLKGYLLLRPAWIAVSVLAVVVFVAAVVTSF